LISRKRLHKANQIAKRAYTVYFLWDTYDPYPYYHDVWGSHRAVQVNQKMFGVYRKTRVFSYNYDWYNDWYPYTPRQIQRANVNYREQLLDSGVI